MILFVSCNEVMYLPLNLTLKILPIVDLQNIFNQFFVGIQKPFLANTNL